MGRLRQLGAIHLYPTPGTVSMYRGQSAESPRACLSLFIAAFTPCSKSTKVSPVQTCWRSSSRLTTSLGRWRRAARIWNGCFCSLIRTPCFRSSLAEQSTSNGPNRTFLLNTESITLRWPRRELIIYGKNSMSAIPFPGGACEFWQTGAREGVHVHTRSFPAHPVRKHRNGTRFPDPVSAPRPGVSPGAFRERFWAACPGGKIAPSWADFQSDIVNAFRQAGYQPSLTLTRPLCCTVRCRDSAQTAARSP